MLTAPMRFLPLLVLLAACDSGTQPVVDDEAPTPTTAEEIAETFGTLFACESVFVAEVDLGDAVNGSIGTADCDTGGGNRLALYFFEVNSEVGVTMHLSSASGFDPQLRLYTMAGALVADDDDGGPGNGARITRLLDEGVWVAAALGAAGDLGAFTLSVGEHEPNEIDLDAIADTFGDVIVDCPDPIVEELALGDSETGSLSTSDCSLIGPGADPYADLFVFEVGLDETPVTISLESGDFDSYLSLYDTDLAVIDTDDDSGSPPGARIARVLDAGVYVLAVSTPPGTVDFGSFTLALEND